MSEKKFFEYYVNKVAKKYQFDQRKINRDKFELYLSSLTGDNRYYAHMQMSQFLKRKIKPLDDELTEEYIDKEFDIWKNWQDSGSNIFDFSFNLLELLKDTDVSDVNLPLIKLPYKIFYIDISAANLFFSPDKLIPIEGLFISEEIYNQDDGDATFEKSISFDFAGSYIENYKSFNNQLMSHVRGFNSYMLFFDPQKNIIKVGESIVDAKNLFINGSIAEDDIDIKLDLYKIHSDFIKQTVNLVVNCLLYLSLKDNDIQEKFNVDLPLEYKIKLEKADTKKRKETVLKEIKKSKFTKIKFVGSRIKKPQKYLNGVSQISPHWRRGHWRNQKSGEKLQENKLIWIMPTIVNKEKGKPTIGHIYDVTN